MLELYGDSARGADWAAVRLRVDGDTIVEADAPGVAEDLRGLTLLEAAAVGGEMLPVDALANAIGPALTAPADALRVAVAMSGGVDSAVTLLKAGEHAVGVTLRLWLDPDGPNAERACCSPSAVIAARETCHARRLPHVTLDLREEFRRAIGRRSCAGTRAERLQTRASAATARFASASCSPSQRASAPRGSRRATMRASSSTRAGCCSRARSIRRRTRATCSRPSIARSSSGCGSPSAG